MSEQVPATNQSFYDRISHAYDLISDAGEHKAREQGEQTLNVQSGENVLEIGFGTGNTLLHLAEAVGESGRVSGIDVSRACLKLRPGKSSQRPRRSSGPERRGCVNCPTKMIVLMLCLPVLRSSCFLERYSCGTCRSCKSFKARWSFGCCFDGNCQEGEKASALEKAYVWMHQHFPHIVDCQPIDVVELVQAGLQVQEKVEMTIWTMPVRCVVATVS